MKIALTIIILVVIALTLYTPSRPSRARDMVTKAQGDIIYKTCTYYGTKHVALFKNELGVVEYFQVPAYPPSDAYIFLYDMEGNEVAKFGGLAPKVEDGNRFTAITSKLKEPIVVACDELSFSDEKKHVQSVATRLDQVKNDLKIRVIYKDKNTLLQAPVSSTSETQFVEAEKLLLNSNSVYITFGSPEYPGTPTTYLNLHKDQKPGVFQSLSTPNTPFTEEIKVEKIVYAYSKGDSGEKGVLSFFVNLSDDSQKIKLVPIRIGLVTKEQWNDMVHLFETIKDKNGKAPFYWATDDGIDY